MELHPPTGISPDDALLARRYRARLARTQGDPAPPPGATVAQIHAALGRDVAADNPAYASLFARLRMAIAPRHSDMPRVATDSRRGVRLVSTPPIRRSTMAPRQWSLRHRIGARLRRRGYGNGPAARGHWHRVAAVRRSVLLVLVLAQTYIATAVMVQVLPYHGSKPLEIVLLVLFGILIGWVSAGFWTAMAGFLLLLRGGDRHAISAPARMPIDAEARTAIVMPICNEDVERVFAGVRATFEAVERSGRGSLFDFFILSDSADPDLRVAERKAWLELCRACRAFGRIFYRLRQHRIKRKSGNIADFCRRWGRNYRYMVVLDADSVMSGDCLVELVRLMEANPDAGIIQTAPRACGRETMYARIQQFATRAYGPLFVAGMHYWQLGEAHYWGHNAIIRVAPFIRHCALARLPGRGNLSGEILSHDFVEAALMRRAGWGVWIAYDLPGSYEEMPPNLIDELKRDRRWCQGNLINSRLFFAHGLHPAHRAVFVTGVMAYASAPLWFLFLVLSTVTLAVHTLVAPQYFVTPNQLFPLWPQWQPLRAMELFAATAFVLFLPKLFGVLLTAVKCARAFGGLALLLASATIEVVFSALLAPIRMLFHTQFVASALAGLKVVWKSPPRDDSETTWTEALRRHGVHTVIGLTWAALVYWLSPPYLWWLLPVAGALVVSIPLSVLSSRVRLGRRLRAAGLFLIPEESQTPQVLRRMRHHLRSSAQLPTFADAIVDPLENAIACASDLARTHLSPAIRQANERLLERALREGPGILTAAEKNALLADALALSRMHYLVWTQARIAPEWRAVLLANPGARGRVRRHSRRRATPPMGGSPAANDSNGNMLPVTALLSGEPVAFAERPRTLP